MKRFILPQGPDAGGFVRLSGKDYRYLIRVRRLGRGDCFEALLPGLPEKPVRVRVVSAEQGYLSGICLPPDSGELADPADRTVSRTPRIILFQALPKGTKMDLIVRQAAEGGVAEIVPFESAYSVPRIPGKFGRAALAPADGGTGGNTGKLERWRRIVKEARQQSGSGIPTGVASPRGVDAALAYWKDLQERYSPAAGILLHETPLEKGSFHRYLDNDPALVAAAVGPEGGFSPEELSRFLAAGFKPLTIGNTVLRTETAALYAIAAIRVILLENSTWMLKTL